MHSLFFLLLNQVFFDTSYFSLNFHFVGRRCRVVPETGLGRGFSSGLGHVQKVGKPIHLHDFLKVGPLVAVLFQQGLADIFGGLADTLPRVKGEVGGVLNGLARDFLVILVVEGEHAAQKHVGDHTEGPVVDLLSVRLLEQNLGCYVGKSTEWVQ